MIETTGVISTWTYKELGSHPYNKKKGEQTKKKNNSYSWNHQRIEVSRQIVICKSEHTDKYREIVEISLAECRSHGRHKLVGIFIR